MLLAIQAIVYLVGVPLELLIIAALLRGGYRQYPFAFAYILGDFITTAIEIRPRVAVELNVPGALREYMKIYWVDERIMQVLMFLVVISLIYRAALNRQTRNIGLLGTISATTIFAGISFFAHYKAGLYPGQWMTPLTRDLNFAAAILDFALWVRLMSQPHRDYRLMMMSSALGIQFAGQAIGQSLRYVFQAAWIRTPAGVLLTLLNLVFLYLFWRAVRVPKEQPQEPFAVQSAEEAAGSGPLPRH